MNSEEKEGEDAKDEKREGDDTNSAAKDGGDLNDKEGNGKGTEAPKERRECWKCGAVRNRRNDTRGPWFASVKEKGKFLCNECHQLALAKKREENKNPRGSESEEEDGEVAKDENGERLNGKRKELDREEGVKVSPENKKAKDQGDMTGYHDNLESSNESIDLLENLDKEGSYLNKKLTKDQVSVDGSSQSLKLVLSQTQTEPELTDAQQILDSDPAVEQDLGEEADGQGFQDANLENEKVLGEMTIPPDRSRRGRSRSRSSSPLSQNLLAASPHRDMEETGSSIIGGLTLHVHSRNSSPSRRTENFDELRNKFDNMDK